MADFSNNMFCVSCKVSVNISKSSLTLFCYVRPYCTENDESRSIQLSPIDHRTFFRNNNGLKESNLYQQLDLIFKLRFKISFLSVEWFLENPGLSNVEINTSSFLFDAQSLPRHDIAYFTCIVPMTWSYIFIRPIFLNQLV